MLVGGMQDVELRVPRLLDHAAREHRAREVVTRWADGSETRTDWAGVARDARRCAQALERLGVRPGDRVATLAMNHVHHVVAWYGAIGMGAVIHTVNPRLFERQIAYILNHAADRVLLYDRAFQPLIDRLRDQLPSIERYIIMDSGSETGAGGDGPDGLRALLDREDGEYDWVEGPERDPCMLCYTSGTTGDPKGVLYTHRSTMLHALTAVQPAVFNLSSRSSLLPIVPMFHVAAWGLPFAAPAVGAKLVLSAVNEPAVLAELIERERVTVSAGVPTIWLGLFQHLDATGGSLPSLELVVIGGSAAPRAMIERLMRMGKRVNHAWGMTETSPIGAVGARSPDFDHLPFDAQVDQVVRQGRAPFGVELRLIDDAGAVLPRDGAAAGRLQCRGPWIIRRYYQEQADAIDAEGWFDTGDVAVIDPDGVMRITDRSKDVIKSGGEWISSVELENAAMGCPGVAEAAAIGVPHPRWDERPLLLVVRKPDAEITVADVMAHLSARVAKWWLPDEILFVDELPHTATGKLLKTALRDRYRDHRLT